MMAPRPALLLLTIHFLTLATSVVSWGPQFEPLRTGFACLTTLKAKKDDDQDPEELGSFRERLELSFAVFDGDRSDPISAFILGEDKESSVTRAFDDSVDESSDVFCDGEACEIDGECEIPESFKIVPGPDSVDVMAFLGIQRAKPLEVSKDIGEWQ